MSHQMPTGQDTEIETGELYAEAQKLKPEYSTNMEAIAAIQNELEQLANSVGLTIELLLQRAETGKTYNAVCSKAQSLQGKLKFYKSTIE